jgi:hypothetical protein
MKTTQENDYILQLQSVAGKMFVALQEAKEIISDNLRTEITSIEKAMESYFELTKEKGD